MDKEAIITQLSRISSSSEFSTKPLMSKFLTYLVNKFLQEEGGQLKAYTIASELFGRDENFDPDQNALVRIYAGRLRRSLKIYYMEEGRDDPIFIEIPKGNYCPIVTNVKQGSPESRSENENIPNLDTNDNTIAVLPFKNLSKNEVLDPLAIGLSHELSDSLTKYDELKVIGIYKEFISSLSHDQLTKQIKSKGTCFLISGEIMVSDNKVKISFRLIHVPDDSQIWASSILFDLEKENLFDILEKVSKHITSNITGAYGHVNKLRYQKLLSSKPTSLNEQELLLKYYHNQTVLTPEVIMEFRNLAQEFLEREPDSVMANALLANIYVTIYSTDSPGAVDAYVKLGELSEKAYNLNQNHKMAFANIVTKCFYYNETDRLNKLYEEGKKWLPNSPYGMGLFGLWFSFIGKWDLGKKLIDKLYKENVFVPSWYHGPLFYYYYRQNDYENALSEAFKFKLPGYFLAIANRIPPLAQLGRLEEAKKEYEQLMKLKPDFVSRGRYILKIHVREDSLVDHYLEGFEKIGVKVE